MGMVPVFHQVPHNQHINRHQATTQTKNMTIIRKLVLSSSFVSLMLPILSLDCHTGENFKMYCGSRDQEIIYSDRCHMVPFPETDSDYLKFLSLQKCEISAEENDTDFECFIQLEYPELSEDFVKK